MLSKIAVLLCLCFAFAVGTKSELNDAKRVVSSLTSACTTDSDIILRTAQTTALYQSANCSASTFLKAVEEINIYSAEFVYSAMEVVTKIGVHFTGCAMELIPLNVMVCVFHRVLELPAEIETLVDVTFKYFANILSLVPPLLGDIESCFTNSSQNYQLVLRDLTHKAKVCEANLTT